MPWSAAPMAYSPIRPKSQISNVGHDGTLSIRNLILMVNRLKNSNFEPFSSIGPYWPRNHLKKVIGRSKEKITSPWVGCIKICFF
jgi:hypothetical protein